MEIAEYQDDPSIPDDAELLRRIPQIHLVADDSLGCLRVSSAAFRDSPNGSPLSVFLHDVLRQEGRGSGAGLVGHPDFSLVSITAG
jgi:hypothetical protein